MPAGEVRFWFQPTTDRVVLFFVTLFGIFLAIRGLKILYRRSLQRREEKILKEKLERSHLSERPEEKIVRDLVERYRIRPPSQLLSSLQQFDTIANEEIARLEREKMDLADRLDRIEFLYSIRMNAFGNEPSVGGLQTILGDKYPTTKSAAEADTETLVREIPPDPVEDSSDGSGSESSESDEEDTTFSDEEVTNLKNLLAFDDEDDDDEGEENADSDPKSSES